MFKQQGAETGGSNSHPHSQCITCPVVPAAIEAKLRRCVKVWRRSGSGGNDAPGRDPTLASSNGEPRDHTAEGTESDAEAIQSTHRCECLPFQLMVKAPLGHGPASERLIHATPHFVVSTPFASELRHTIRICPRRRAACLFEALGPGLEIGVGGVGGVAPSGATDRGDDAVVNDDAAALAVAADVEIKDLAETLKLVLEALYMGFGDPR
jgi:hypothetical protein